MSDTEHDEPRLIPVRRPPDRPSGVGTRPVGDPRESPIVVDTRRKVRLRHENPATPAVPGAARPAGGTAYGVGSAGVGGARGGAGGRPPAAPDQGYAAPRRPSARVRRRRVAAVLVLLVLGWIAFMVGVPMTAWGKVERVDNAPAQRAAAGKGHTYLLVGSDSREGLTAAEAAAIGVDTVDVGKRTDSIMLVHLPDSGKPVLISVPRDSYVAIAGHGSNKINAAFAFGGPKLLTQAVETATGVRIDGYLEIGFGGFARVVDSVGGVEMCPATAMKDSDSGLDIQAGCQLMNGRTALAYVRDRHSDPRGDLGRAERQRQFLAAIIKKAASPSTALVPWRYKGFADAAAAGLVVGGDTSLSDAVAILQALRSVGNGDGISLQVPVADPNYSVKGVGSVVKWDEVKAKALFTALRTGQPLTAG